MTPRETFALILPAELRALFQAEADARGLSLPAWFREAGAAHCYGETQRRVERLLQEFKDRADAARQENGRRGGRPKLTTTGREPERP